MLPILTIDNPHPADCPGWEYEHHPQRHDLAQRVTGLLMDLVAGNIDTRATIADTRTAHQRLFVGLTPERCDYFAGHYRGEPYRCLRYYRVQVPNDPRVGIPPENVRYWMGEVRAIAISAVDALDADPTIDDRQRLGYLIALSSRIFELFLRVHPYANGNGHSARFLVWCILGRYGHWPRRWTIDPRPNHPGYTNAIVSYRNGDPDPLETLIASMLV